MCRCLWDQHSAQSLGWWTDGSIASVWLSLREEGRCECHGLLCACSWFIAIPLLSGAGGGNSKEAAKLWKCLWCLWVAKLVNEDFLIFNRNSTILFNSFSQEVDCSLLFQVITHKIGLSYSREIPCTRFAWIATAEIVLLKALRSPAVLTTA